MFRPRDTTPTTNKLITDINWCLFVFFLGGFRPDMVHGMRPTNCPLTPPPLTGEPSAPCPMLSALCPFPSFDSLFSPVLLNFFQDLSGLVCSFKIRLKIKGLFQILFGFPGLIILIKGATKVVLDRGIIRQKPGTVLKF